MLVEPSRPFIFGMHHQGTDAGDVRRRQRHHAARAALGVAGSGENLSLTGPPIVQQVGIDLVA
jgi:hypothetical protein